MGCLIFLINKSGDGAISQATSADDVLIATGEEAQKLTENRKLLMKQKLGGGNFNICVNQDDILYFDIYISWK